MGGSTGEASAARVSNGEEDEWSQVGRKGAVATTRGDESLQVQKCIESYAKDLARILNACIMSPSHMA